MLVTLPASQGHVLDYSFSEPSFTQAVALGYVGVHGYMPWSAANPDAGSLTRASIARIHAAGMGWAGIWEVNPQRPAQGYAVGHSDGVSHALGYRDFGVAPGAVAYWACDYDADPATVAEYGRGFRDAAAGYGYISGAYGSARVIDYLVGNGVNTVGWQAEAWSSGRVSDHASLIQRANYKLINGTDHNDVLKPITLITDATPNWGTPGGGTDDMTPEETAEVLTILRSLAQPFAASMNQTAEGVWIGGTVGAAAPAGTTNIIASVPGTFSLAAEAATTLRLIVLPSIARLAAQATVTQQQLAAISAKITGTAPVPVDIDALAHKILAEMLTELRTTATTTVAHLAAS